MKSKIFLPLVILLVFVIMSCTSPVQTPTVSGQNINIEIQITGSDAKELSRETIPQNNCNGNAEVENSVERSRSVEHTIEVQNGVSVNANGQVGFAGTDIELGATVASQLGQSYGTAETLTRSITVKAKPGTNMQHIIRQVEIWKVGQAKISVGGQQTIIPFKFRSDFAIELAGSDEIICPNGTADVAPTNTQPLPQLTITPEVTEAANWAIIFEYHFPSGFWSVGTHEYTLESDCPNLKDSGGSWTNTFNVSEAAPLLPEDVYLRLVGLRDEPLPSNPIEGINPLQTTTAAVSMIDITHSEAELAFTDCKVSVSWDGGPPKPLVAGSPFER